MRAAAAALFVVLVASCSSEAPLDVPDGCQPLEGELSCTLPYPSDFFFQNGVVALSGAAKPRTPKGLDADVVTPLAPDGFSREPTIVGVLPDTVVSDGLPSVVDGAELSLDPAQSPTLLLDAETGELVPHYVDLDPHPDDDARVAIAIRPFVQLAPGRRYVVALRGVKNASGSRAAPAEGFRRLRDRDLSLDPSLAALAARFDGDVFAPLAAAGVSRGDLQLAWDFTTASQAWSERDMLDLRALVQAWLDQNPAPAVAVTDVEPDPDEYYRIITGTITAPLYLDQAATGGVLHRGADGKVAQNGTTDVPFQIVVPRTVIGRWGAARGVAFGHGFFGSTAEMLGHEARVLLSTLGVVGFGIDWWGMSKDDLGTVVGLLSNAPSSTGQFVERVYQAMANWMVTTRAMRTSFALEPALHRPLVGDGVIVRPDGTTNAGGILYDPSHVYYFGASMGHILGSVMSALDPDVERAVLEVGGASWEQMMPRAGPFAALNLLIKSSLSDELATQAFESMLATALDRIDPATYAPYLVGASLPGNPDRQVLLQAGIGDAGVPNCATFFQARLLGLSMVQPSPETVYGIPLADASGLSSALTLWDFGISPDVYREPSPPADNPVHNGLRNVPTAMAQMDAFLQTNGPVIDPCAGPCTAP
jgi:hypothetical protein